MKRLIKAVKREITDSAELVFDQTGVDITQLAREPVKTIKGKSVVTPVQLKAICDISKPMAGSGVEASLAEERVTLANHEIDGLPDSILV